MSTGLLARRPDPAGQDDPDHGRYARALDPDFVLADAVRPFAERLVRERLSPLAAGRQALRARPPGSRPGQAFPRRLDDCGIYWKRAIFTVGIDVRRLNVLISRLNSMVNRLAFAMLVAALIVVRR